MGTIAIKRRALFSCMLVSLFLSSSAQTCTKYTFASNKLFTTCNDLPFLNAFLHWTYDPSSGNFQIAYQHTQICMLVYSWGAEYSQLGIYDAYCALIARYVKVFEAADPAWFSLHVSCQTTAYIIGLAGWGTGLQLDNDSPPGIKHSSHRYIGITLFVFGTLQVFALLLRPQKDHKYRLYWNIYHHSVGYLAILLSIINIFKGFDILNPEKKWQRGYAAIIVILSITAIILEGFTWFVVLSLMDTVEGQIIGFS